MRIYEQLLSCFVEYLAVLFFLQLPLHLDLVVFLRLLFFQFIHDDLQQIAKPILYQIFHQNLKREVAALLSLFKFNPSLGL